MKLLVLHVEALISLMKHEWTLYKTLWHEAIPLVIYLFIYLFIIFLQGRGDGGLGLLLLGFIINYQPQYFYFTFGVWLARGGGGWGGVLLQNFTV